MSIMIKAKNIHGKPVWINPNTITYLAQGGDPNNGAKTWIAFGQASGIHVDTPIEDLIHEIEHAHNDIPDSTLGSLVGIITILADPIGAGLSAIDQALTEIREALNRKADRTGIAQPPLLQEP